MAPDSSIDAVGVLVDPVRRALYRYVAGAPGEVGRDEAAEAAGVSRSLAAFHLDKLVEAGLLASGYRRLTGRTGPGAGRPAKMYHRADAEHAVHLPPREYEVAARLLSAVVERAGLDRELQAAAFSAGIEASTMDGVEAALAARGYQPYRDGDVLRLRNCPFHGLAREYPPLICGMNLAYISGLLGTGGAKARMDPTPGGCCVSITDALSTTNTG